MLPSPMKLTKYTPPQVAIKCLFISNLWFYINICIAKIYMCEWILRPEYTNGDILVISRNDIYIKNGRPKQRSFCISMYDIMLPW